MSENTTKTKGKELCNRTACQTDENVYMFNATMDAYYCVDCATAINKGSEGHSFHPLCVIDENRKMVSDRPTYASKTSVPAVGISITRVNI